MNTRGVLAKTGFIVAYDYKVLQTLLAEHLVARWLPYSHNVPDLGLAGDLLLQKTTKKKRSNSSDILLYCLYQVNFAIK